MRRTINRRSVSGTNNKRKLYESIMKDVSKTVKKHLNEISKETTLSAINKATTKLNDKNLSTKERRGYKSQLNTFNNYYKNNFQADDSATQEFYLLYDAIESLYQDIDILNRYDEDENNIYNINWDNIKKYLKESYEDFWQYVDMSDANGGVIDFIVNGYLDYNNESNIYNTCLADDDYPGDEIDDRSFRDYGQVIRYFFKNCSCGEYLCEELPEFILNVVKDCPPILGYGEQAADGFKDIMEL